MQKYDTLLILKITLSSACIALINYLLFINFDLKEKFELINFFVAFIAFVATISLIVLEYLKNEYLGKSWFSKCLSFFADLMLISFVLAILYVFVSSSNAIYQITLMTLPYFSAFIALYTNKYAPFLDQFTKARDRRGQIFQDLLKKSAEQAVIIRKRKAERKERINSRKQKKLRG